MTAPVPMAVIGAGHHATELRRHAAPLPDIQIAGCALAPNGHDEGGSVELARHFGAAYSPDWRRLIDDPNLPAVLVLSSSPGCAEVAAAALNAGKVAICPFPPATDTESLAALADAQARGGGVLLSLSEIAGTAAGANALQALREGQLGKLHSVWAAGRFLRRGREASESVLDQYGWQVLDFVLSGVQSPVARVHATLANLFEQGSQPDTAVVLIRFEHEVIVTIELSRCLPGSIAAPDMGEVEIEVIGAKEVVRIEPHASAVRVYGEAGASTRSWTDGPLVRTLPQVAAALRSRKADDCCLERARRALAIMETIRRFPASVAGPQAPLR
jgi:predicted dehydrogenase